MMARWTERLSLFLACAAIGASGCRGDIGDAEDGMAGRRDSRAREKSARPALRACTPCRLPRTRVETRPRSQERRRSAG